MILDVIEYYYAPVIVDERNKLVPGILRTPFKLTQGQQMEWYHREIEDRRSMTRYWALKEDDGRLLGYGGIENIQWEVGMGEMSLLIFEDFRGLGYGKEAVKLFLEQAFDEIGLDTVFAEVYECNPNLSFWQKRNYDSVTRFPRRKRTGGKLYDSQIFVWKRELWEEKV